MSEAIITVENLSKCYRIGARKQGYKTFREAIMDGFKAPITNLKRIRKLTKFDAGQLNHSAPLNQKASSDVIWALKDVSFQVKEGEILGIIGRNGAGKTTLLKILSRITEPTLGDVKLYGRVSSLLEVGTGFHPELTGRENIHLNGAILGMQKREIDHKFDEIVSFAEIEKFIDTPVKRYSSGMYVRLAFAVAAHLEPEILLVDEVLAVGDAAFQKKCLGKMSNVAKEGRTVLFVSHNMAAVDALCTDACLLVDGELALRGTTSEVIDAYIRSIKEKISNNLGDRKDRSGNRRLIFTGVTLEDSDGTPVQNLISGKDPCIVLHYKANGPLKNVSVSIGFYSLYGQFLLLCNNEMVGHAFELLPQNGQIRCSIPKLPFASGVYNLNLYCEVNGILADWVQEACQITVVEGDYFGTGRSSPAGHGGFVAYHSWAYKSIERANE